MKGIYSIKKKNYYSQSIFLFCESLINESVNEIASINPVPDTVHFQVMNSCFSFILLPFPPHGWTTSSFIDTATAVIIRPNSQWELMALFNVLTQPPRPDPLKTHHLAEAKSKCSVLPASIIGERMARLLLYSRLSQMEKNSSNNINIWSRRVGTLRSNIYLFRMDGNRSRLRKDKSTLESNSLNTESITIWKLRWLAGSDFSTGKVKPIIETCTWWSLEHCQPKLPNYLELINISVTKCYSRINFGFTSQIKNC